MLCGIERDGKEWKAKKVGNIRIDRTLSDSARQKDHVPLDSDSPALHLSISRPKLHGEPSYNPSLMQIANYEAPLHPRPTASRWR